MAYIFSLVGMPLCVTTGNYVVQARQRLGCTTAQRPLVTYAAVAVL